MAIVKRTHRQRGSGRSEATRQRDRSGAKSADFAEALGASRTFPVFARPHGPFGVAALLDEVRTRLVSRGGRPIRLRPCAASFH
jgi:hypothetical protein